MCFTLCGGCSIMMGMCIEGIENWKFEKQNLGLVGVGTPILDVYRTMYKVWGQLIRNCASGPQKKMKLWWCTVT